MELIRQCFIAACNIYTRCAASTEAISSFNDAFQAQSIQHLISLISQISPSAHGAHALVWVCFVAGAASTDQTQRDFLVQRMEQVYVHTQFRNIPTAIRSLEDIWTRSCSKRWTVCLPQLANVLIM